MLRGIQRFLHSRFGKKQGSVLLLLLCLWQPTQSLASGLDEYAFISPASLITPAEPQESWKSLRTFPLTSTLGQPIQVYIQQNSILYKPHYTQYIQQGLQAWSQALSGRLVYKLTNNPRNAQIKIYWVSQLSKAEEAGVTEFQVGRALVKLKTTDIPDALLQGNILHELGHALGLAEHSPHNEDIMVSCHEWHSYEDYLNYVPKLSARDVFAIRRLYSAAWKPGEDLYLAADIATSHLASLPPSRAPKKYRPAWRKKRWVWQP